MSNTDEEVLEELKLAYDAVVAQLKSDKGVIRYGQGDVQISRAQASRVLKELRGEIAYYQRRVDLQTAGRQGKSYVSFGNEPMP